MTSPGRQSKPGRRGVTDAAVFNATGSQELTSILNAPESSTASSWLTWLPAAVASSGLEAPPPLPPGTLPEVRIEDFARYLSKIGERYESFEQDRASGEERVKRKVTLNPDEVRASQGQGLVAALREVPALFFQESFELDRPELWGLLGDVTSDEGRQEALDKLGHYLDVVETHLVREIAARSDNFFDASCYIQDLQGRVFELYQEVAGLRAKMAQLSGESGAAVQASQHLQQQRANALATLETLRAVEEVAQAQAALQALLPQSARGGGGGVAADFVGAIDVLEVLQGVLDNQGLLALDCFRTLPQQIAETAQAVDDLMATDFLERARFAGEGPCTSRILQRLSAQLAATQTPRGGPPGEAAAARRSRLSSEGSAGEAEAAAGVKLADSKALDVVVAWVERAAAGGDLEGSLAAADEAAGPSEAMQDLLLPLVMGLRRIGRLSAALKDLKDSAAADMQSMIRRVVEECLGVLVPGPADTVHLLAGRDSSPPQRAPASELLQQLPGEQFQWVLEAVLLAVRAFLDHHARVGDAVQAVLQAAKAPHSQAIAAAEECRAVCQAAAEAAMARWAKLLSGRAHGGAAAAARLSELRDMLGVTDVLSSLVEGQGAKAAVALRSSLQQLCKASLDAMHTKALGKLANLLEQEHWQLVEVAPQFQAVVDKLQARASEAAAQQQQGAGPTAAMENGRGASSDSEVSNGAVGASDEEGGRGEAASGSNGWGQGRQEVSASAPIAQQQQQQQQLPPSQEGGGLAGEPPPGQAQQGQQGEGVPRKFTITPPSEAPPPAQGSARGPQEVLLIGAQRYHVVNTALLLLNMLGDYLAFRDAVPSFAAEVAQRVLELLKIFNSRTCQLVLGAGAMQVSGLKSITAKHLAISCQCLGVFVALHPALTAAFTQGVPQPRRDLLAADFTRTVQDYVIHRDEICSKLVFIMRERLSMNLKQLPAIAAGWGSSQPAPGGPPSPRQQGQQQQLPPPSSFAATNVKQLQILSSVLGPLLLPEELHSIFGRVATMFGSTVVEAFSLLEPRGPAWERQLQADVLTLLECLEQLPLMPDQRDSSLDRLRLFYKQRFEGRQAGGQGQVGRAPGLLAAAAVAGAGSAAARGLERGPSMVEQQQAERPEAVLQGGHQLAQPSGDAEPGGAAAAGAADDSSPSQEGSHNAIQSAGAAGAAQAQPAAELGRSGSYDGGGGTLAEQPASLQDDPGGEYPTLQLPSDSLHRSSQSGGPPEVPAEQQQEEPEPAGAPEAAMQHQQESEPARVPEAAMQQQQHQQEPEPAGGSEAAMQPQQQQQQQQESEPAGVPKAAMQPQKESESARGPELALQQQQELKPAEGSEEAMQQQQLGSSELGRLACSDGAVVPQVPQPSEALADPVASLDSSQSTSPGSVPGLPSPAASSGQAASPEGGGGLLPVGVGGTLLPVEAQAAAGDLL